MVFHRQELLKWYGWGYKDSAFRIVDETVTFTGNRSPAFRNEPGIFWSDADALDRRAMLPERFPSNSSLGYATPSAGRRRHYACRNRSRPSSKRHIPKPFARGRRRTPNKLTFPGVFSRIRVNAARSPAPYVKYCRAIRPIVRLELTLPPPAPRWIAVYAFRYCFS
ncbi:hypothetical protein EVAR_20555_1 [Eumeta japonica]|uniref:Alkylglycerone-phosphate synthase n=1 Tax=Eumeta variegata TaxID=151549 RepID=A0A4C1UTP5_EUMVA|nr:hypothetical protein EVAR_20555_1 [Eumeta japonica]